MMAEQTFVIVGASLAGAKAAETGSRVSVGLLFTILSLYTLRREFHPCQLDPFPTCRCA